jgi:hypothetical protein
MPFGMVPLLLYCVAPIALATALFVWWSSRPKDSVESAANLTSAIWLSSAPLPTRKRAATFCKKSIVLP